MPLKKSTQDHEQSNLNYIIYVPYILKRRVQLKNTYKGLQQGISITVKKLLQPSYSLFHDKAFKEASPVSVPYWHFIFTYENQIIIE